MKNLTKLFACLLALLMLTAAFAACTGTEDPTEKESSNATEGSTTPEETTAPEVLPEIEKNDYSEYLYMQTYKGDSILEHMWVEKSQGDVVSEALYNRQQKLMDYLGVELIGTPAPGDDSGEYNMTYTNAFATAVKNKDGSVDLFIPNAYVGVPGLIKSGYIMNLKNIDTFDFDADYWNTEYMDSIAIYDRYYLGYSDFCIPKTHLITFNKKMMEQYGDALGESIYTIVDDYRWTIDQMISLANLVYIDATGDGKTEDDTFGITGQQWIPFIGFLHASNIQLVEENDAGEYEVSVYNEKNQEKTVSLVDKLGALAKADCAWFRYRVEPTAMIDITSDRTLMMLSHTASLDNYLEHDVAFGVLPYPMYDETQKDVGYRSMNYDGYIAIPSYSRNLNMTAESVELLSFWGEDVNVAVYEKLLGKQVANSPDDSRMLDYVWDGICIDFGLTYSHLTGALDQNLYMLPTLTNPNGTEQIASYVNGYTRGANTAIEKFMKQMKKMGDN